MKQKIRKVLFIISAIGFILYIALIPFVFREDIARAKMMWGEDYIWHLSNPAYISMILFLMSILGLYAFKDD
jgi:hypothetical protein